MKSVHILIAAFYIFSGGLATAVNNTLGAAFSTVPGTSTDENGLEQLLTAGGLNNILSTTTASGSTISSLFTPGSTVATISITAVPEPTTGLLVAAALASLATLRRRNSSTEA
jgi:hypothetical protein